MTLRARGSAGISNKGEGIQLPLFAEIMRGIITVTSHNIVFMATLLYAAKGKNLLSVIKLFPEGTLAFVVVSGQIHQH